MTTHTTPAIDIDGKELIVRPPKYPSAEVKEQLGGRWDKAIKAWRVQPTALSVQTLVDWYGEDILEGADEQVQQLAKGDWGFPGFEAHEDLRDRAYSHQAWPDLYPFQQEAVEYLVTNPHKGAILALSPGLGKAPTSIVAMDVLQCTKVLIVAPLTLARNWQRELDRWAQMFRSWSRATRGDKDPRTECVIVNHEVLFEPHFYNEDGVQVEPEDMILEDGSVALGAARQKKWVNEGPKVEDTKTGKLVPARKRKVEPRATYDQDWDLILIDESILLKNRKAVKVDVLMQLTAYAENVWLLSGSPTAKHRDELWPQVRMIMPRGFTSYWRFAEFFCVIDRGTWGWKIEADRPDHDPQRYLKDFMFTRNQKDVLPDLPDYIYDPIEIDLNADQQKAFNQMSEDWQVDLLKEGVGQDKTIRADIRLAQMTRLAQITSNMVNLGTKRSSAKEDLLLELIRQGDIELPLLVWCWWVPTATSVYDRLLDDTDLYVDCVVGSMKSEAKDEALDAYRTGRTDALVLQMGVGKFGHTLTDTRTVYYHDRHFDSDAYFQSLRRVKRIGLTHRPRLIVPRSMRSADPMIELNLAGKMQSIARLGSHDLRELLRSLGSGMVPWAMETPE